MRRSEILDVLRRQWIAVVAILVLGTLAIVRSLGGLSDSYSATAHVLLVTPLDARDPAALGDLPSLATAATVLERVRTTLALPGSLEQLKDHVSTRLERPNVMEIAYSDSDKTRVIAIANALAQSLANSYGTNTTPNSTLNVTQLSTALDAERGKIGAIDAKMRAIAKNSDVAANASPRDITDNLDRLRGQRAFAAAEVAAARHALANAIATSPRLPKIAHRKARPGKVGHIKPGRGAADRFPGIAEQIAGVHDAQAPPQTARGKAPIASARVARDRTDKRRAQARLAGLDASIAQEQTRLSDRATVRDRLASLQTQREATQRAYAALSKSFYTAVANPRPSTSQSSIRVLDRAIEARKQFGTRSVTNASILVLLLLALAAGAAYALDFFDPRRRHVAQIERLYGCPVIAHLAAGQMRALRLTLEARVANPGIVVVAGATDKDGSDFAAFAVADSLAAAQHRTLLIRRDDARSTQLGSYVRRFGESDRAARKFGAHGLLVIDASDEGITVQSTCDTIAALFARLREEYTYVVVDTGTMPARDAAMIAGPADAALIAVSTNRTRNHDDDTLARSISSARVQALGIVTTTRKSTEEFHRLSIAEGTPKRRLFGLGNVAGGV